MNHLQEQLARERIHQLIHRNDRSDRSGIRRSARLIAQEARASRRHAR